MCKRSLLRSELDLSPWGKKTFDLLFQRLVLHPGVVAFLIVLFQLFVFAPQIAAMETDASSPIEGLDWKPNDLWMMVATDDDAIVEARKEDRFKLPEASSDLRLAAEVDEQSQWMPFPLPAMSSEEWLSHRFTNVHGGVGSGTSSVPIVCAQGSAADAPIDRGGLRISKSTRQDLIDQVREEGRERFRARMDELQVQPFVPLAAPFGSDGGRVFGEVKAKMVTSPTVAQPLMWPYMPAGVFVGGTTNESGGLVFHVTIIAPALHSIERNFASIKQLETPLDLCLRPSRQCNSLALSTANGVGLLNNGSSEPRQRVSSFDTDGYDPDGSKHRNRGSIRDGLGMAECGGHSEHASNIGKSRNCIKPCMSRSIADAIDGTCAIAGTVTSHLETNNIFQKGDRQHCSGQILPVYSLRQPKNTPASMTVISNNLPGRGSCYS